MRPVTVNCGAAHCYTRIVRPTSCQFVASETQWSQRQEGVQFRLFRTDVEHPAFHPIDQLMARCRSISGAAGSKTCCGRARDVWWKGINHLRSRLFRPVVACSSPSLLAPCDKIGSSTTGCCHLDHYPTHHRIAPAVQRFKHEEICFPLCVRTHE